MNKIGSLLVWIPLVINILFYLFITLYNSGNNLVMNLDGLIIGLIALAGVLALIGIGSMFFSFSDVSVKIFISIGLYIGVWVLFSLLAFPYYALVPMNLGLILFSVLSGLFTLGCITSFTHINEGD